MHKLCMVAASGLMFAAGAVQAQDDKFAGCPEAEAARQYVKACLAANPYKTKEACEELALEKFCKK